MNIDKVLDFLHNLVNVPNKHSGVACSIVHDHNLVTLMYINNEQWQISIDSLGQGTRYHMDTVANTDEIDAWVTTALAEMCAANQMSAC